LKLKKIIKDNIEKLNNLIQGNLYTNISDDDLIIFTLIIGLISVIIFKFNDLFLSLIMFLIKKIIIPNTVIILLILITFTIYKYKNNFIYDIYDFLLVWIKIFTFQWLM